MDGAGVRKDKFIGFIGLVIDSLVIVKDRDFFRVFPDFVDDADVSVKHVLVVVVADLHHAIAGTPIAAGNFNAFLAGVQEVLQEVVQFVNAERSFAHRREELHILRVNVDFFLDAARDEAGDDVFSFIGRLVGQKVEVRAFDGRGANALIDFRCFVGDVVSAGLAENVLKAGARNLGATQQVVQHIASSHAGELVGIAHENDSRVEWRRFEERCGKPRIDHTEFIDNEQIALELVVSIAVELPGNRIHFEQTVDGSCLFATTFAHALGGAPRRGGEAYAFFHLACKVQDSLEDCRLACAGATCDNRNLSRVRHLDSAPLNGVKAELVFAFPLRKVVFKVVYWQFVVAQTELDVVCYSLFGVVKRWKIAVVAFAFDATNFACFFEFVEERVDGAVVVLH